MRGDENTLMRPILKYVTIQKVVRPAYIDMNAWKGLRKKSYSGVTRYVLESIIENPSVVNSTALHREKGSGNNHVSEEGQPLTSMDVLQVSWDLEHLDLEPHNQLLQIAKLFFQIHKPI